MTGFGALMEQCVATRGRVLVNVVCSACDRAAITVRETEAAPLVEMAMRQHRGDDGTRGRASLQFPLLLPEPDDAPTISFQAVCWLHGALDFSSPAGFQILDDLTRRATGQRAPIRHVVDPLDSA